MPQGFPINTVHSSQGHKRWHELITSRITDSVKLVGPTISCEGSPQDGNVNGVWRTNPHVQSYVLATDQVRIPVQAGTIASYNIRCAVCTYAVHTHSPCWLASLHDCSLKLPGLSSRECLMCEQQLLCLQTSGRRESLVDATQ